MTWKHKLRRNVAAGCIIVALFLAVVATAMDDSDRREETWL